MKCHQETSKKIYLHIGKRLLLARALRGISQEQLGERVGVSCQQIRKYEAGVNEFSVERLFEFSTIFDVPLRYFFMGLDKTLNK